MSHTQPISIDAGDKKTKEKNRRNVVTPLIQYAVVAVINSCDNRNIIPINKQY